MGPIRLIDLDFQVGRTFFNRFNYPGSFSLIHYYYSLSSDLVITLYDSAKE